jgi:hypothetical protein
MPSGTRTAAAPLIVPSFAVDKVGASTYETPGRLER